MSDTESKSDVWLVYGSTGWIGSQIADMLEASGKKTFRGKARLENSADCEKELDEIKPNFVMNCAGLTGRPNVDWCEDHKEDVMRVNVIGTLSLADLCSRRGIHLSIFATGCIYSYDDEHPIGGKRFTEEDEPNFTGSYYSYTKGLVEKLLRTYESNTLVLRLRMPISDDLSARNFITKITKYRRVVNIPNSMTVLTDMLPVAVTMAERKLVGIFNYTNPDPISHVEILELYKEHIDPDFWWEEFSEEEQNKILKAARSNNTLDTTKIVEALPDVEIPDIRTSIVRVFERMKANLIAAGTFPPPAAKPPRDEVDA